MTEYTFQEGIPSGFSTDFNTGIFHDQRYFELQTTNGWYSFVLLNNQRKAIVGLVHYYLENHLASSPFRSPYGSFVFSKELLPKLLREFVAFTELKLKEKGVQNLLLKNPPDIYAPAESKLLYSVLTETGYEVKMDETSAVIIITQEKFESILHRSERKRLRKCKESGLRFQQVSINDLPEVYQFLAACRDEKGYALSMSLDELRKVVGVFVNYFFLTTVTVDNAVAAANISILVNEHVLYNFYHDHKSLYDSLSPVVLLNEGLYEFCQQKKISLLDLGTSNAGGQLNESLLNFKLRLGAQPSRKLTFVKKFL